MKIIVTHTSPDMDAITSVWLIKRFLPGWEDAKVFYVPAGQRYKNIEFKNPQESSPVERYGDDEVIHVDTGFGPLDHHQASSDAVCGASLSWDYVRTQNKDLNVPASEKMEVKREAISRIVSVVISIDHFKEVFWKEPTADYHEFQLMGVLEGLKQEKPDHDDYYTDFVMRALDALVYTFENRIWAEKEIREKGVEFKTKWGKGLGFETLNDTVLKLSQKMGNTIVVRKDPRKGYVRIKAKPYNNAEKGSVDVDLTVAYEALKKIDPGATWFLHVSRKMLLNGTPKNPKMRPTKLSLEEIIKVLQKL